MAADVGVAASTLRGWLRLARLERELAALRGEGGMRRRLEGGGPGERGGNVPGGVGKGGRGHK